VLFPERMKDLTVMVYEDHVEDVIEVLHERGVTEISDIDRDAEVKELVEPVGISESLGELTDYDIKLSSILDIFERLETEKSVVKEFIFPEEKKKVKRRKKDLEFLTEEIDRKLEKSGEKILKLDERLTDIDKKVDELEQLRKDLELISFLDLDLSHIGESNFTVTRLGVTEDPTLFRERIKEIDAYFYEIEKARREEEDKYIVVASGSIQDRAEFESILRQSDVRPLSLEGLEGTPQKALKNLSSKIESLKSSREDILKKLKALKNEEEKEYRALKEELDILREKKEVIQNFGNTESTTVLKGWTPKDEVEKVRELVERITEGHAEVIAKDPEDPDEVPCKLNNPNFIEPYEMLTHMFAPPRYDEIDPTFILAPAFVIFFGIMLGDAIYGILIILTSVILLRGIGKIEKGIRNFSYVLLGTGLSTFIFGILQGGYLGPAQDTHTNLFGRIGLDFINDMAVLETLEGEGPLVLLIISLLIGLFYLNTGFLLQFIKYFKDKNYRAILKDNVSWWTLQPGGFILISGQLFGWWDFSSETYMIAWGLTGVGLLLMVLRAKGLSFFELTGFLGDFLSFSRILALGLATSGIALTVNVLADLVAGASINLPIAIVILLVGGILSGKGIKDFSRLEITIGLLVVVLGVVSFVAYTGVIDPRTPFYFFGFVVAVIGHLGNAVLQALGAFVHSLRLQYVEFFGTFYEGGGAEYTPFEAEREFTELSRNKKEVKR